MNFTGVEGENITFGPGDMVLTPHDTWHNHGNQGDEPAINLSVLDVPLVRDPQRNLFRARLQRRRGRRAGAKGGAVRTVSVGLFPAHVYGNGGLMPRFLSHDRGTGNASPMYVYRWEAMRELLESFKDWDGDPHEALNDRVCRPDQRLPVFKTITFFAQMLRPGERTLAAEAERQPAVRADRGPSGLQHGRRAHAWTGRRSTPSRYPGGHWCEHVNASETEPAVLFVASDEPTLKALVASTRSTARHDAGDIVRLA